MWDWLHRAREMAADGPYVIVTVVECAGSVPRGTGTKMLVSDTALKGTIGGGNLEFKVIEQARKFLEDQGDEYRLQSYALGPLLAQCCGGNVTILLERVEPGAEFLLEPRHGFLKTYFEDGSLRKEWVDYFSLDPFYFQDANGDRFDGGAKDAAAMVELVSRDPHTVYMFGAGHVGRAVSRALEPLPFDVVWVDAREDEFPQHIPVNHSKHVSDDYCGFVDEAKQGALYLIFSHNHQRDYELTARVMARGDAAYCGLIGSATKRARFENRLLKDRVVTEEDLPKLICPIGVPSIKGKEPEVIAASVAAQLLSVVS
jgi:xanthine dehydrogenase accessory factor